MTFIHFFQISVIVELMTGDKFQQLFKFADIDWCKFMKKGSKAGAVLKLIIDAVKSSSSGPSSLLHRCPYSGPHAANISVSTSVLRIIPPGLYRLTCLDTIDADDNFLTFVGEIRIGEEI